ncbi:MAG: response regulator [Methanoregula sp.]|jgi:DNA-binding NarL/FixJ family response regulator
MPEKRILIVEDETIVAMTLEEVLHDQGYSVAGIVSSADDAILATAKFNPDLILMDIRIRGDRDGISAAEEINRRFNIPIVYLTSHSDDKTLARAVKTRPYGYLLKPFRPRELHTTIEIALYKHRLISQQKNGSKSEPQETPRVPEESPGTLPISPGAGPSPSVPLVPESRSGIEHVVLDVIDLPVFVIDRDLHIVYYNAALERFFTMAGYLSAKNQQMIFEIAPSSFLGTPKEYRDVFESRKSSRSENTFVLGERMVTYSLQRVPLFGKDTVAFLAVILKDITRELVGIRKGEEIREGYEDLLQKAGEISTIVKREDTADNRAIAKIVGDMVITLAKIDPQWPLVRER